MLNWKKACLPQQIDFSRGLHYKKENNYENKWEIIYIPLLSLRKNLPLEAEKKI
jgi:hypothetical protein